MPAEQGRLGRIRAEMAKTPGLFAATPSARPARPRERLDVLRRELSERWPESLARFVREFERVGGVFHRVASVAQVPDVIASIAAEREMRKVVWPSRPEVQSTTIVVLVTVFIFAAYFWLVDNIIGRAVEAVLHRLTTH